MGVTKREVADQLGVAKQTVVNYIDKLDLAPEHVTRVGKTDVLDDFAVSALADALGKNVPARSAGARPAAQEEDAPTPQDTVIAALNARIADLKEQNERLVSEIAEMRARAGGASRPACDRQRARGEPGRPRGGDCRTAAGDLRSPMVEAQLLCDQAPGLWL